MNLTRVVTDILGASARAVLSALIAGQTDPERLADCTTGRRKASRADIVAAVHGRVTAHHRSSAKGLADSRRSPSSVRGAHDGSRRWDDLAGRVSGGR